VFQPRPNPKDSNSVFRAKKIPPDIAWRIPFASSCAVLLKCTNTSTHSTGRWGFCQWLGVGFSTIGEINFGIWLSKDKPGLIHCTQERGQRRRHGARTGKAKGETDDREESVASRAPYDGILAIRSRVIAF